MKNVPEKMSNFMDPLIFPQCQIISDNNISGLINISKLEIIVYISLIFQIMVSIMVISNLVDINGKYKSWDTIKHEYNLTNKEKF